MKFEIKYGTESDSVLAFFILASSLIYFGILAALNILPPRFFYLWLALIFACFYLSQIRIKMEKSE